MIIKMMIIWSSYLCNFLVDAEREEASLFLLSVARVVVVDNGIPYENNNHCPIVVIINNINNTIINVGNFGDVVEIMKK